MSTETVKPKPLTAEELLDGNKLEEMIESGRVPHIYGNAITSSGENFVFCSVPPEGVTFEDEIRAFGASTYVEFISPDGKSRGSRSFITMTQEQAEIFNQRRETKIQELIESGLI